MSENFKERLKALLAEQENKESTKKEEKSSDSKEKSTVPINMDEIVTTIKEVISSEVANSVGATQEVDKNNLRSKLFESRKVDNGLIRLPNSLEELKNFSDDEIIVTYFQSLSRRKDSAEWDNVYKALVEGTVAEGGALVPKPLQSEIIRILPDITVMRNIARIFPMTAKTLDLPNIGGTPVATWSGEYTSKATSSVAFGVVTLTAQTLVSRLPASEELIADANIDVVKLIIELFAESIGKAEDKAFFTGSGIGRPRGINQETLKTVNANGNLTFSNIVSLFHSIPARERARGTFVANSHVINILRDLKDANNNFIWRQGLNGTLNQTEMLPDILYSRPVYEQNDLSNSEIYFGNFKFYAIGDRQQVSVDTTRVGGDAWVRYSTEVRAATRVDGRVTKTGAFAKIINP